MARDDDLPTPREVASSLPPAGAILPSPQYIPTVESFSLSKSVTGTRNTRSVQDTGLGPSNLDPRDATADDPGQKASPFIEIGSAGLAQYGGFVRDEFLPQLQGDKGLRVFREMYDNDPIVGALVFTIQMLLRKVEWRVEPPAGASVEAIVAARQRQRMQMLAARRMEQQAQLMAQGPATPGQGASQQHPGQPPVAPPHTQPQPPFAAPVGQHGPTPFHAPLPEHSQGAAAPGQAVAGPLGHPQMHPAGTMAHDNVQATGQSSGTPDNQPGANPRPTPFTRPGDNSPATPNSSTSNPGGGPNQHGAMGGQDGLPGSRPASLPSPADAGSDTETGGLRKKPLNPNPLQKAAIVAVHKTLTAIFDGDMTKANELMARAGLYEYVAKAGGSSGGQFAGDIEALGVGVTPTDPETGEAMEFPVGTDPLAAPSPEEQHALELAVFVETCLHDMVDSWADTISQIITMIVYGFAYHELVYKKRNGPNPDQPEQGSRYSDGRIGWAKIAGRAQETRHRWEFDEYGNVLGMWQLAPPKFQLKYIPMSKALLFRTTGYKQNPEGRSILRSAYRPWYFKRRIEEIEAIGVERDMVGIPVAYVPYQWMSPYATNDEKAALTEVKEIVKNVRIDEQAGLVLPSIYDPDTKAQLFKFELLSNSGSSRKQFDTDKIIARYDQRIAMVALVDFILLGHETTGSKALADTKTDLFTSALEAWLAVIADVFNTYAIPRLMQMNGEDPAMSPRLTYGKLTRISVTEIASLVTALAGAGADMFPDVILEDAIREAAGLPPKQSSDDL